MRDQDLGTVVIGGSQAGLAVGYHLWQRGLPFVILKIQDGGIAIERCHAGGVWGAAPAAVREVGRTLSRLPRGLRISFGGAE